MTVADPEGVADKDCDAELDDSSTVLDAERVVRDDPVALEEIVPDGEGTNEFDMAADAVIDLRTVTLCASVAVSELETVGDIDTHAETESALLKLNVDVGENVGKLKMAVGVTDVSRLILAHPVALIVINAVADFVAIDDRVTEVDRNADPLAELVGV